jgi:predicted RNase H-like HicB family nuclease
MMDGKEVSFTVRLFREGDAYVAHVPELDISSCGDTKAETRRNIKDAVGGFLKTAEEQGTLVQILEEAGYRLEGGRWHEPEIVSTERMQVRVA